jgi:RHS repeat-associated protein
LAATTRYLYQGWNLVVEFDTGTGSSGTGVPPVDLDFPARTYHWGMDSAGTLTQTGGVGALLMIQDGNSQYFPAYDGNGNVTGLLDSEGETAAVYEYSPYGELLRCQGSYAKANPFRFSTKYWDEETGMVYYGLRYYSPQMGKFINRDPIGKNGGLNLYGFVRNNPINLVDVLGMDYIEVCHDVGYWDDGDYTDSWGETWQGHYQVRQECTEIWVPGIEDIDFGLGGGFGGGGIGGGAPSMSVSSLGAPTPVDIPYIDNRRPSEERCNELKGKYGKYINAILGRFTNSDINEVALAALIQSVIKTTDLEMGGAIYKIWHGEYTFTPITPGYKTSWGWNTWYENGDVWTRSTYYTDQVANPIYFHTHPIGPGANEFSSADMLSGTANGGVVYMEESYRCFRLMEWRSSKVRKKYSR